ncbi:MAG: hypothetical protein HQK57_09665 [Deltaproteobacteria bacterium]|nr:hypothetical protein [Deltaproteobacteria bacterium]MBF0526598.1 hypothetical protein [Deltaproteobacteria bacterium]
MADGYTINGLTVQPGDLICTSDGGTGSIKGQFWRLIGNMIPGEVDHIVIYVGPDGQCVEAGAKGRVVTFKVPGGKWDIQTMGKERGPFVDVLHGVAYPLKNLGLPPEDITRIRQEVVDYCLVQARLRKPYNLNFFDSSTEAAFYCSQLAYKAYLRQGINLNTGKGIPNVPGTDSIIFPQEIWEECAHIKL